MPILSLAGKIYGLATGVRNRLYDRGVFKSHDLGARTISIGNITTGGTGKTPLVANVASVLEERGEKVCILTRGYGRRDSGKRVLVSDGERVLVGAVMGGDEPVELARQLIGKAIVVADADRVAASRWALEKFGVTTFVLDDGFQHRRAERDLDIVCIDALAPWGGGAILPAGRLREKPENWARADVIVITRADLAEGVEALRGRLLKLSPKAKIFEARTRITGFVSLDTFRAGPLVTPQKTISDSTPLVFCALGNPLAFLTQVALEFRSVVQRSFPDHHRYNQTDIRELEAAARESAADALVTTAKDAVKLLDLKFEMDCYVALSDVALDDPAAFDAML